MARARRVWAALHAFLGTETGGAVVLLAAAAALAWGECRCTYPAANHRGNDRVRWSQMTAESSDRVPGTPSCRAYVGSVATGSDPVTSFNTGGTQCLGSTTSWAAESSRRSSTGCSTTRSRRP